MHITKGKYHGHRIRKELGCCCTILHTIMTMGQGDLIPYLLLFCVIPSAFCCLCRMVDSIDNEDLDLQIHSAMLSSVFPLDT